MIEYLKFLESANKTLSEMDEEDLNRLYLRLFNTDDGLLVLQDLANRCFMNSAANNPFEEGARRFYLTVETRIRNAVAEKKEDDHV